MSVEERARTDVYFFEGCFVEGVSATAASAVSIRKVKVSCRYSRTAASVWLR
jgi:hypothetical protein